MDREVAASIHSNTIGSASMSIYHIIYKTTNIINGKWYIGVHSTDDLNDGYLGSGVRLLQSVSKYGEENFTREILYFFDTREAAFNKEKEIITEDIVNDRQSYNMCIGGNGGVGKLIPTDETRHKMSETRKKLPPPGLGKKYKPASEERKQKMREYMLANPTKGMLDKTQSEETRKRMSKAAKTRPHATCPKCGWSGQKQSVSRYHGLDGSRCDRL